MNSATLNLKPKRNPSAISTLLPDGHLAIVKLGSLVGYTLCPAGAILWELCDGNLSVAEMIAATFELLSEANKGRAIDNLQRDELDSSITLLVEGLLDNDYLSLTE